MKKRASKIILLVLSLALLVGGAIGISVSADTAAPEIISKNVKADGNFSLIFAIDPATVTGEDVTVTVYNQDPTGLEGDALTAAAVQTITKAATDTTTEDLDGDGTVDDVIILIETKGVAAKDIADVWYIVTESNGVKGDVVTYSVMEYAFERLYKDGTITAKEGDGKAYFQKEFYLDILEIGSSAQELLVNYPNGTDERLANEYIYVYVQDGSFAELGTNRGFVEKDTRLTIIADNGASIPAWQVNTYNKYGVLSDSQTCTLGSNVTVAGNTVIIPDPNFGITPGSYYDDIGTPLYNFNSLTGIWGAANLKQEALGIYHMYWNAVDISASPNMWTNGGLGVINAADTSHGKVLELKKTNICKPYYFFPVLNSENSASNCVVFEADIFFDSESFARYDASELSGGNFNYNSMVMYFLNTPLATTEDLDGDGTLWESGERTEYNSVTSGVNEVTSQNLFYAITGEQNAASATWATYNSSGGVRWETTGYEGKVDSMRVANNAATSVDLQPDTWYNLCIEVTNTQLRMYIDGELAFSKTVNVDVSTIKSVTFTLQDRFLPIIHLDNVVCTKVYK